MKKSIYLDNASKPYRRPGAVAMNMAYAAGLTGSQMEPEAAREYRNQLISDTKSLLKELFHAPISSEVVFLSSTEEAVNLAHSVFEVGTAPVLTTVLESNRILRPLADRAQHVRSGLRTGGFFIVELRKDGSVDYESIRDGAMRKRPGMIICSAASEATGERIDLEAVSKIAKTVHAAFVVDVSYAAGILDIDMEKCGIDAVIFSAGGALKGPEGIFGLVFQRFAGSSSDPFVRGELMKLICSGTADDSEDNVPGIAGFNAGLRYCTLVGVNHVSARTQRLARDFYDELAMIPGIETYGSYDDYRRAPIVAFNIGSMDSVTAAKLLKREFGIRVSGGDQGNPLLMNELGIRERGLIRVSFSDENNHEEIRYAVRAIRTISKRLSEQQ